MSTRKMHADELDIDVELVARLVAAQFPEWAELPLQRIEPSGTDNAIYRLGSDKAARLPRRQRDIEVLAKELAWLPRLAPLLPLPIPVPLAAGVPGDGYPCEWAVYRWLDGAIAAVEPIADLGRAARDLAQLVSALQGVDLADGPQPGSHNAFRGVPLATRDESSRAAITKLGDAIDVDAVTAVWDAALAAPVWDGLPVWIHGDLDARNLLVREGRLSGVIDFGCLGIGDPACDVMVAWKMLDAEARGVFRSALSVDDATWARSRGWALSQALMALSYYTEETNLVLVVEARRWLAEVLADHTAAG